MLRHGQKFIGRGGVSRYYRSGGNRSDSYSGEQQGDLSDNFHKTISVKMIMVELLIFNVVNGSQI